MILYNGLVHQRLLSTIIINDYHALCVLVERSGHSIWPAHMPTTIAHASYSDPSFLRDI